MAGTAPDGYLVLNDASSRNLQGFECMAAWKQLSALRQLSPSETEEMHEARAATDKCGTH